MREFGNDLIFEIILRLPLKVAIRLKILNKTLNSYISRHIEHKHFVESKHKISNIVFPSSSFDYQQMRGKRHMCQLQLDQPYAVKCADMEFDKQRAYQGLDNGWEDQHCTIIASCGGLVLIYSGSCRSYCVFNPITTEFQLVPSNAAGNLVGLAVDSISDSQNSYRYIFRLVGFFTWINESKDKVMFKFTIFGFDSSQYWKEIYPQEFSPTSVLRERDHHVPVFPASTHEPVYLHGSIFWLLNHDSIIAFNLEKRRAIIIGGPPDIKYSEWFGEVQGSLCILDSINSEYVMYAYDHAYPKTWQIRHRIMRAPGLEQCSVLLFDRERLFINLWRDRNKEIFTHSTSAKEWKNIRRMPDGISCSYGRVSPFVPTLAKLYSDSYLHCQESREKLSNDIRSILDSIHRLFSSRNIDNYRY